MDNIHFPKYGHHTQGRVAALLALTLFSSSITAKDSLASFEENGSEYYDALDADFVERSTDGYRWDAYDGGKSYAPSWGYLEIDKSTGAINTSRSLKLTVTGGRINPYEKPAETCGDEISSKQEAIDHPESICSTAAGGFNYWFLNPDSSKGLPFVEGANRISFYTKIPKEFTRKIHHSGEPENYTLHFGTYTRDPGGSYSNGANLGRHFYHWMNFSGTGEYWTKVIIDQHPQHEVGKKPDPGHNPTAEDNFNYIEGLTRFYFKTKSNLLSNPWSAWIDEFEIYNDPRPMPPKIATIAITQIDTTSFDIDFASTDEGGGNEYVNQYEVRYSFAPINDGNFYDATLTSGSPSITGDYERYAHNEVRGLDLANRDIIYFAIRQTDENDDQIAYAEYQLQTRPITVDHANLTLTLAGDNGKFKKSDVDSNIGTIQYIASITNNGENTASNIVLDTIFPEQVTSVATNSETLICDEAATTCQATSLAMGESISVSFVVTTANKKSMTFTGSVSSDLVDPDTSDNIVIQKFGGALGAWVLLIILGSSVRRRL